MELKPKPSKVLDGTIGIQKYSLDLSLKDDRRKLVIALYRFLTDQCNYLPSQAGHISTQWVSTRLPPPDLYETVNLIKHRLKFFEKHYNDKNRLQEYNDRS